MRTRITATGVILALAAVASGCGDDGGADATERPVELTETGACGEPYFWAATRSGDMAVTVTVEARDRSTERPTTIPISLPDHAVQVDVLRGHDLARNFCTDVLDTSSEPTSTERAKRGHGEIVLDPSTRAPLGGCGSTKGTLRLTGLEGPDGTEFAPVSVSSKSIGCYSG